MKFQPGKTYQTRSICDSNCIISVTVAKRTARPVLGKVQETAIFTDEAFGDLIASCETSPPCQQAEANARLIAAAPDLLAALMAICNAEDEAADVAAMKLAIAAIAKATGQ